MKTIAIIPARGNSKVIPGKNLAKIGGLSLIEHTIRCAKNAKLLTKVVLTTDCENIAEVAEAAGCQVINRPKNLAQDDSSVVDAILHTLSVVEEEFDAIVLLQPTAPLRTGANLDEVIEILKNDRNTDAVVSVVAIEDLHPARMYRLENLRLVSLESENETKRRQDLDKVFIRNGCFYVIRSANFLREKTLMIKNKVPYEMDANFLLNIDTPRDLKIAEIIYDEWKTHISDNRIK